MKKLKLRPLRIPSGWTVEFNVFCEDDEMFAKGDCIRGEDLLQLRFENLIIDLGWYPDADVNGRYKLYLVDTSSENPFENPIETFETKSTEEVIERLESILDRDHDYWKKFLKDV